MIGGGLSFFKKDPAGKRPLRDKNGRPYYLSKVPWHNNPRLMFPLFVVGSLAGVAITFAYPMYCYYQSGGEKSRRYFDHELKRGYTDSDYWRAKRLAAGENPTVKDIFNAQPDMQYLSTRRIVGKKEHFD